MAEGHDQELTLERLSSGDRPSIIALGVSGAESLKLSGMAIFVVDVLGRVQILPPSAVTVLRKPKIPDEELDQMDEDRVLDILVAQGESDEFIVKYLMERKGRVKGGNEDL
jgi:hypothetical protein